MKTYHYHRDNNYHEYEDYDVRVSQYQSIQPYQPYQQQSSFFDNIVDGKHEFVLGQSNAQNVYALKLMYLSFVFIRQNFLFIGFKRIARGFCRVTNPDDNIFAEFFSARMWTIPATALAFTGLFYDKFSMLSMYLLSIYNPKI